MGVYLKPPKITEDLVNHVVTCKPGFDKQVDWLESHICRLDDIGKALLWYIRNADDCIVVPAEGYPIKEIEFIDAVLEAWRKQGGF